MDAVNDVDVSDDKVESEFDRIAREYGLDDQAPETGQAGLPGKVEVLPNEDDSDTADLIAAGLRFLFEGVFRLEIDDEHFENVAEHGAKVVRKHEGLMERVEILAEWKDEIFLGLSGWGLYKAVRQAQRKSQAKDIEGEVVVADSATDLDDVVTHGKET